MNNLEALPLAISGILVLWVSVLTFFYLKAVRHYQKLTAGITKENLMEVLGEHFTRVEGLEQAANRLKRDIEGIKKEDLTHVQRVGLIRFNPFDDTGGNQSFALALLNDHGDGVVISSLHSRETTRIYGKPVKGFSESGFEFSSEEKQAIEGGSKMRFVDNLPPALQNPPVESVVEKKEEVEKKPRFKLPKFEFFRKLKARFDSLPKNKKVAVAAGGILILLVLLSVVGYATYSYIKWNRDSGRNRYRSTKDIKVDVGEPKDFESPINGIFYTRSQGNIFDKRRPMAIMVNNHVDARPIQSGLPEADIIFEAVAEGGITRFLAIYHANDADKVGPVRSARVYYLDWSLEFHAWYAHWGGASTEGSPANAYDYMRENGIASLDAFWIGECETCAYWRDLDSGVSMEHTGFTATQRLYKESAERWPEWAEKVPFDRWLFKEDAKEEDKPSAGSFTFNFWNLADYEVTWEYDPAENVYLRSQGGQPHQDAATGEQLAAKNIIIQFTKQDFLGDEEGHLLYQTVGSGKARVFLDGKMIDATWEKTDREMRTRYYDEQGFEIKFNRGQIWVEIVPGEVVL